MNVGIDTHVTTGSGAGNIDDSPTDEDVKWMGRVEVGTPALLYSTGSPDVKSLIYEIAQIHWRASSDYWRLFFIVNLFTW
jgi:hypothetical protein